MSWLIRTFRKYTGKKKLPCDHVVFPRRMGPGYRMKTCGRKTSYQYKHNTGITNLCTTHYKIQLKEQGVRDRLTAGLKRAGVLPDD